MPLTFLETTTMQLVVAVEIRAGGEFSTLPVILLKTILHLLK